VAPGAGGWTTGGSGPPGDDLHVVLLDHAGTVVAANPRWAAFAEVTGADPAVFAPGASFRAFCATAGPPAATLTEHVIESALAGRRPDPMRVDVHWATSGGRCAYRMTAGTRYADDGTVLGATVTLRRADEPEPPRIDADTWMRLDDPQRVVGQALDTIDDAVVIMEIPSLEPVYVNRAGLPWVRPTDDGRLDYSTWAPLDPDALSRLLTGLEAVATGRSARVDLVVPATAPGGDRRWLDVRLAGLLSSAGRPERVLLVSHDISDRVRVEERLRISEKSFRATFERSGIPTLVLTAPSDGRRRVVMANQAMADAVGRMPEELLGTDDESPGRLPLEADVRRFAEALLAGRTEESVRLLPAARADGTTVWFDVFVNRIDLAGDGSPAALTHLVDVTEKVLAAHRRERRTTATTAHAELLTRVLAGEDPAVVEQRMLEDLRDVLGVDDVLLARQDRSSDELVVVRAAGRWGAAAATACATFDLDLTARHFASPETLLPGRSGLAGPDGEDLPARAAARFDVDGRRGWIVVVRREPPCDADELQVLGTFSRQAALAIELGRARSDQERLGRLEERQRLARDLHDTVLQDLIAMGVQLGLLRPALRGDAAEGRVIDLQRELIRTVRVLRDSVFQLRRPLEEDSFEDTVKAVIGSAGRALGHQPTLTVTGDLESVPNCLRADVAAALQEALSNVLRHARAGATDVSLHISERELVMEVADDGIGPGLHGDDRQGDGLSNLVARAASAGGTSTLRPGTVRGAVLRWAVPLRRTGEDPSRAGSRPDDA
jgi:PAS domain S-box-containing protein